MFQILSRGYQNISIETWIRAAKFSLKIPIRYEDINKKQTEFSPSGMHKGSILFHDTQSNDARSIHKLCLSFHTMSKLMREEVAFIA